MPDRIRQVRVESAVGNRQAGPGLRATAVNRGSTPRPEVVAPALTAPARSRERHAAISGDAVGELLGEGLDDGSGCWSARWLSCVSPRAGPPPAQAWAATTTAAVTMTRRTSRRVQ